MSGLGGNQLSTRTIGEFEKVPAADIKGSGNKLAFTVKSTEINVEDLRKQGSDLGVAAGNPVDNSAYKTNQSYQYFAVSDDNTPHKPSATFTTRLTTKAAATTRQ